MARPSQPELRLLLEVAAFVSEGLSSLWPDSDHELAGLPSGRQKERIAGAAESYTAEIVVRLRFGVAGTNDAEHSRAAAIASVEEAAKREGYEAEFLTVELAPDSAAPSLRDERSKLQPA